MQLTESNDAYDYDTYEEESSCQDEKSYLRARSAPARPLTEIEEFRKSKTFAIMEKAVVSSAHLIQTYNNRYDMESEEGQAVCKTFLKLLEKLHECFKSKKVSREYRDLFSNAYQMLYKGDNYMLYYLDAIIDSAQEAVPCLYVNGKRFEFSEMVLESGRKLSQAFIEIQNLIRKNFFRATYAYENSSNCVHMIQADMTKALDHFDICWTNYEKVGLNNRQLYIKELMTIEAEARKYITDAISLEKEVQDFENKEKAKGTIHLSSPDYHELRNRLVEQISQINSVANYDGKGRDDLNAQVLIEAESILCKISPNQSKSVRKLAENIRTSFANIRQLLKKFDTNIEAVDPQLKNNDELVKLLLLYEKYWERGKHYFLNRERCLQLIHFSSTLEGRLFSQGLCEKHDKFMKMIEYREAEIFLIIPMIMIIKSCEGDDKGICEIFLPDIKDSQGRIGKTYQEIREALFENDYLISKNTEVDKKTRTSSLSRSLKFSRKVALSPDRRLYMDPSKNPYSSQAGSPTLGHQKYKTILGNKSEYIGCGGPRPAEVGKEKIRKLNYIFYNLLEKMVLNIDMSEKETQYYKNNSDSLNNCILKVKSLSMELERHNPTEWNTFLDVALES